MAGSEPGEPLRGIGRRRFVGKQQDPVTGQEVNVYELAEDDEWAPTLVFDEHDRESEIHVMHHKHVYEPRCKYCNLRLHLERG